MADTWREYAVGKDDHRVRYDIETAAMISPTAITTYSQDQWRTLQQLRVCYLQARDLWSAREWAHLQFLRWLVQTGRLIS